MSFLISIVFVSKEAVTGRAGAKIFQKYALGPGLLLTSRGCLVVQVIFLG